MSKALHQQFVQTIELLQQGTQTVEKLITESRRGELLDLLEDCQQLAIAFGTKIEKLYGEGTDTVAALEAYCEKVYETGQCQKNQEEVSEAYRGLWEQFLEVKRIFEQEFPDRKEIVFFPYKASMWDSLESVYLAAKEDPDCDAYCAPIPYYDKKSDGSFGEMHYEGEIFPEYVPVTDYRIYNMEERRPDAVFIHNPYDYLNKLTSVAPQYYSDEIKKYTDCLVYIPYYATTGGMAEGQSLCMAYLNADYIVIQAEKYRKFFDPGLPDRKFLPLGSPKFDKVIRMCQNPPEPQAEWKEKMAGKKVYFYNTSLGGMLADPKSFLMKMEYVFHCFEGREDCCLLWRPHPLMESAFDSMCKQYRPFFEHLKEYFLQNQIGIYDDTPDIEKTIALSDVYIGDEGTSVTSLFGVAGKPLFILNNAINTAPEKEDWRGEIITEYFVDGQDDWVVTQGNKLYHAPNHDYKYEYYCNLSQYAAGMYYLRAIEMNGKIYVCPANAQNILVIQNHRIVKEITLRHELERDGAFVGAWYIGSYLYLIPFHYPAIVRCDTRTDQVDYIEGYQDVFARNVQGEWRFGGSCVWKNYVMIASPDDNEVLAIDSDTMQVQRLGVQTEQTGGCMVMVPEEEEIWLLPHEGTTILRWNPLTGQVKEYNQIPENFQCKNRPQGYPCMEHPFSGVAFTKEKAIVSPYWGNKFLAIDKRSGEVQEWIPPFPTVEEEKNGYWNSWTNGMFLRKTENAEEPVYRYYYDMERRLYDINIETGDYKETAIVYDIDELRRHEPGFCENSDWFSYCCQENAFCTLSTFLDGTLCGAPFDRERQLAAFATITANMDGTCGEKVYQAVSQSINDKGESI